MNSMQIFDHKQFGRLRVIGRDGEPWFVASEIARTLGYANPWKAVMDHCKAPNETLVPSDGGEQQTRGARK